MPDAETKKGRPKSVIIEHFRPIIRSLFPEIKSERGVANKAYELDAFRQFMNRAEFRWLGIMEGDVNSGLPCRSGVLQELGRIENEALRETVALELCRKKSSNKDARRMIREFRVGKPTASIDGLATVIINAACGYITQHSKMPRA